MKKTVAVVVLGDLGRSPRMSNHALSLANEGLDVKMIGYDGASLNANIADNANITVETLWPPPSYNCAFQRYINYLIKCIWQPITLLWCLLWRCNRSPDFVLLQNPPTIPALPICYFYCKLRNYWKETELVLDWHNYGYSIMALSFREDQRNHPLVRLSSWVEGK